MSSITAVITTSVIPSHPSTELIDKCLASIRFHLPDVPMLILADGIHPNHQFHARAYEEYLGILRSRPNVRLVEFSEYTHQAGMIRDKIDLVETPLILWVEHDFILTQDPIDWAAIEKTLLVDCEADSIRFSDSNHKLSGGYTSPFDMYTRTSRAGVPLIYTREYMSFPNVARKDLYEAIIRHMKEGRVHVENVGRDFIEHTNDGFLYDLAIYNPEPRKRSQHLNGRGAGEAHEISKPPMSGL